MVALGFLAGIIFPPFVVVLGVPRAYAYTAPFIGACLLAGLAVGGCHYLLARTIVGKRERQFRSLVHNASDIIVVIDERGAVRFHTPSLKEILGHAPRTSLAADLLSMVHPDDRRTARDQIRSVVTDATRTRTTLRVRLRHRDGSWRSFEAEITDLLDDPHVAGIVLNARDVTDRVALEEQLAHQALHDPLTGLANRALFLDRVEHAVSGRSRNATDGAPTVLFIDLDDFKTVNDSLGHARGDELLVAVADRLSRCLRHVDTAARLGGDEFAILVEDAVDPEAATSVARRVLEVLSLPLSLGVVDVAVAASIGIAKADGTSSAQELLRNADVAMYAAKSRGKNRYEHFDASMHRRAVHRLSLKADLGRPLERGELFVVYQPIVDLRGGSTVGFEALLRWRHPQRGLVGPLGFIPFAEETGLIVPIGQFVLEQACAEARTLQAHRPEIYVSVNVSGTQLRHPRIVEDIASALSASGLSPGSLTLELTESVLMHDTDATADVLHRIKALGIRVAIDDFGTGYSSLGYLRRFPVDVLKIDRSFITELGHGPDRSALTRGIVSLARSLQVETVAEGIEDAHQLADLQTLECNLGQGYYFARPLTAVDLQALLAAPDDERDVPAGQRPAAFLRPLGDGAH
jgi:diguanylate cyclase (GGDEF)-like protein/PAS domain S-box-containing protein